jgi:hypothetical protein
LTPADGAVLVEGVERMTDAEVLEWAKHQTHGCALCGATDLRTGVAHLCPEKAWERALLTEILGH